MLKASLLLAFVYVFFIPILAKIFPAYDSLLIMGHEVLSSIIIATVSFRRLKFLTAFSLSFLLLALADFFYGFTSEIILNQNSIVPSVVIREFAYTGFAVLLSVQFIRNFVESSKGSVSNIGVILLTCLFVWVGLYNVMLPLFVKPDSALVYVGSGVLSAQHPHKTG